MFGGFTQIYTSYSSAATSFATPYLLGTTQAGLDPATLIDSKLIILWGANIRDTRFGCEMENRLIEAKKNGTDILVVDPRRSKTAKRLGSRWIPVRPGTDAALMCAVLYVLIEEKLLDRAFIQRYSSGFEELERYVLGEADATPKTPA